MKKIIMLLLIALSSLINDSYLYSEPSHYQQNDSVFRAVGDSIMPFQFSDSTYLLEAEIEHQKLIRNIFVVSFIFIMALLIFTMFFYGSKIKKVSNIIIMQNDALNATKDQLLKIINIFNYVDQQIYITDSNGNIEWINAHASTIFKEPYENNKTCMLDRFSPENKELILKNISENRQILFNDNLFGQNNSWKMIPVKNSKGEFSNIVFIS